MITVFIRGISIKKTGCRPHPVNEMIELRVEDLFTSLTSLTSLRFMLRIINLSTCAR